MTSTLRTLSIAALVFPLLHGCGGSSSDASSSVRLVNATTNYSSLDLNLSTSGISTGVASLGAGTYGSVASGTQALSLQPTSGGTASSANYSLAGGTAYTVVAYIAPSGSLTGALLTDNEAAPATGTAKFRVFNTVSYTPSGATTANELLDAYLVTPAATACSALASTNAAPVASSVRTLGAYTAVTAAAAGNTYRLCVTGAGDRSDLRLEIPAFTLKDQQITTLMLTSASGSVIANGVTLTPPAGGVLVNGVQIDQQSTVTARTNPSARLRVVADAANRGAVTATLGTTQLVSGLVSPAVGVYTLVPAGTITPTVQIGGVTIAGAAPSVSAPAGADVTMLVAGSAAAPAVTFIPDDNRPSTTGAKLRLVNGVNGLAGGLTLLDNFAAVASNVTFGTASAPTNVTATTATRIEVTSASAATLFLLTGDNAPTLATGRVYSVFMLGDAAAPAGLLRQDR